MPVDRATFEELVRRHHAAVFRTAWRLLRSDADAQDVTQQVFLRTLQGKSSLPQLGGDAAASLRWLAARLALNHLRATRRRRAHEEEYRAMRETDPGRGAADHEDERRAVQRALRELPDELRVPIVLRFQEGMTLAAVAGVLGCAESTAHERVSRGLGSLRRRLQRLGFAAAVVDVEESIAGETAAASVPAGLESMLLGLTVPLTLGVKIALGAAVLVGVAVTALRFAGGGGVESIDGPAPADLRVAVGRGADAAAAGSAGEAPERRLVSGGGTASDTTTEPVPAAVVGHAPARLTGRVIEADSGLAIAGARVRAASEEHEGKFARFSVDAETDHSGRFDLELPVAHAGGQAYRLLVTRRDHVPFRSERLVARPAATLAALVAELRGFAEDVPGEWSMEVLVTDAQGTAVPRAIVKVLRRRVHLSPGQDHPQETGGRADDSGRITLRGDRLGEKLVRVHAFGSEYAPEEFGMRIADTGPHQRHVVLEIGATITGVLQAVEDAAPIAGLWVEAHGEHGCVAQACSDPAGRFVLRGLGSGAYDLTARSVEWSPFRRVGVPAGANDVTIRLKLGHDPRPQGEFLGEIHGRIVDALSGEPVPVDPDCVRTLWLPPEAATEPQALPGPLAPPPVQTMEAEAELQPDADGRFVLRRPRPIAEFHHTGLSAGRYVVAVWSPSHAAAFAGPFEVGPGRMATGVELRLNPGSIVRGRVRDARGAPVENAVVWIAGTDAAADRLREQVATALHETGGATTARLDEAVQARSDAAGSFRLPRIPAGYELRLHVAHGAGGHAGSSRFVLRPGAREHVVDVVLPQAATGR